MPAPRVALVEGAGCSRALVCPYHGWTYRLDGSLSHVPHADGFPDLDMSVRGLVEVASREVDGLIVIGPCSLPRPIAPARADAAMAALQTAARGATAATRRAACYVTSTPGR